MSVDDALVMILAGGEGKRLYPLTKDRAKPAVPFAGRYRIIDFVLNNFLDLFYNCCQRFESQLRIVLLHFYLTDLLFVFHL